ncbi:glucosamine-6-phosphate isomerase 2 [Synechococcus elongatus PCC 6301]|uniref:Glucosamine-6-phosphate isomerase 2 n=1 Tax=Synechococcus sp. (strain ATCC 27144 / PCC 6301 / SAUG 1402/1) TaxID=269084 RepID=A0A0H3K0T2_SYNP6|nr:glucosamine-6-phosphate deaminase [Synechococcus elongatus]BAD78636.1 glucosamine-6-phosphate isomerase 2 [Synechococcus elongatus PCC 6301]
MRCLVFPSPADVIQAVADRIADRLQAQPDLCLGLATGRTMVPLYAELLGRSLNWQHCRIFALDEYWGLATDHPSSFAAELRQRFCQPAGLRPEQVQFLNGAALDPAQESQRYRRCLKQAGGLDLQLLGLGENGHLAFNEPGSARESRVRLVQLSDRTRQQNAGAFGGDPEAVPSAALSLGLADILEARELLWLVTGASKTKILAQALQPPPTTAIPASYLQEHPATTLYADHAAAAALTVDQS